MVAQHGVCNNCCLVSWGMLDRPTFTYILSPLSSLLPINTPRLRKDVEFFVLPPLTWRQVALSLVQRDGLGLRLLRQKGTLNVILRQAGIQNLLVTLHWWAQQVHSTGVRVQHKIEPIKIPGIALAQATYLSATIQSYISGICTGQGSSPTRTQLI